MSRLKQTKIFTSSFHPRFSLSHMWFSLKHIYHAVLYQLAKSCFSAPVDLHIGLRFEYMRTKMLTTKTPVKDKKNSFKQELWYFQTLSICQNQKFGTSRSPQLATVTQLQHNPLGRPWLSMSLPLKVHVLATDRLKIFCNFYGDINCDILQNKLLPHLDSQNQLNSQPFINPLSNSDSFFPPTSSCKNSPVLLKQDLLLYYLKASHPLFKHHGHPNEAGLTPKDPFVCQ